MTDVGENQDLLQVILDQAKRATAYQNWADAERLFQRIALAWPETSSHWHNLALVRTRAGLAADRGHQRRAVLLTPSEPKYLNNLLASESGELTGRLNFWLLSLAPDHARALADRAFHYLTAAKVELALRAARRAQVVEPGLAAAAGRVAQAALAVGRVDEARAYYQRSIWLDPSDRVGVGRDLARVGAIETKQAMTPAFVAGVFDSYASNFDSHLTGTLRYVGPEVLARMLEALSVGRSERAMDLGCGSGLSGLALRPFANHIVGVDLSARMLKLAEERDVYDRLYQDEIVAWLERSEGRFGIAMAADVTSYIGDLAPFFHAIANALEDGGLLAMTVHEQSAGTFGIVDGETYSHSEIYVQHVAAAAGLKIERRERGAMREEKKQPLATLFLVLRKS
jgi:predicted TPR repeat methyltransferase